MAGNSRAQLIQDVLGSAHIFSSAVNDLMEEKLRVATGSRLTFSQLKLLKLVDRADTCNISEIAAFLGVSNAAASKGADRLVRRGLLRRSEAESDRRAVELALTPEGRRMLDEYQALMERTLEDIFGQQTEDGLRETADLLDRLSIRLVDHEVPGEETCFRCSIHFREKCLLRTKARRSCHFQRHTKSRRDRAARARNATELPAESEKVAP